AYEASCAERGIPAEDCSLIGKVLNDFASANYFWIFLTLLAFTFSNLSRAIRWNMLLRPLGYKPRLSNAFLTVILGYFANLGFPRIGEVVRAGSMARYEHIPVEKVMGTIVVDRTIDVISILLITSLAILLEFDTMWQFINEYVSLSEKFGGSGPFLLTLAAIGLFFVALIYFLRKRIAQWG
ncbi:MAG: flippase-like domain-containing protein, partial [Saprospiraceae bacterium]|nr:flippase-like domain-containing protein [Saprospiraceae bacterium]